MAGRAEALFKRLQSADAIQALMGHAEDADFDCKEWPERSDAARGSIAKAACGFANATGGVIVIGVKASGSGTPDVVLEPRPVPDMGAVASAALDIVLSLVEPGIEGVATATVPEAEGSKSGVVLILIPGSEGGPHRSRVNPKEFYVRVASGTIPMEYFQIEDRFGRRPHPRLFVEAFEDDIQHDWVTSALRRLIRLRVRNEGRGIARFLALRYERSTTLQPGLNSLQGDVPIWPFVNAGSDWLSFRGTANDVLHPGEMLQVATLFQSGQRVPHPDVPTVYMEGRFEFGAVSLSTEILCDGAPPHRQVFNWPARS